MRSTVMACLLALILSGTALANMGNTGHGIVGRINLKGLNLKAEPGDLYTLGRLVTLPSRQAIELHLKPVTPSLQSQIQFSATNNLGPGANYGSTYLWGAGHNPGFERIMPGLRPYMMPYPYPVPTRR